MMFEIFLNDESLEKDLFLYIYLVFRLQSTTRLTNGESTIFVNFCFISIADNLTNKFYAKVKQLKPLI